MNYIELLEKNNNIESYNENYNILKENLKSSLFYYINGGTFKINHDLINFLKFLCDTNRIENIIIMDMFDNPINIENVPEMFTNVVDKYFRNTNKFSKLIFDLNKSFNIIK